MRAGWSTSTTSGPSSSDQTAVFMMTNPNTVGLFDPADRHDRRAAARAGRPALPRRRQHERDPRGRPAGRHGRRPDALQPAQDLLRPARRRRPRGRADRRPRAPGPVSAGADRRARRRRHLSTRPRPAAVDRPGAVVLRQHRRALPRLLLHPQPGRRGTQGRSPSTPCSTPIT